MDPTQHPLAPPPAEPEADPVQLLTPEGERVHHPAYPLDITPGELRDLYRDMVVARRFDAEAVALQRQGELALWTSLRGQEAAQVGSAHAARADDFIFPTYREHAVALHRGVDPMDLLRLYRGVNNGSWSPTAHGLHIYTLVIGAPTLHATGYAMGVARDGAGTAVLSYFGDGASSQGDVAEAFNFAAVHQAPVVFFCQNNQWAISTPVALQTRVPIHRRAAGFGFPGIHVDGNDVLAVLAVTQAALAHARAGAGPVLIEALTYRMDGHATSDDPTRYRADEETAAWARKDPIDRLATHLTREGLADAPYFAAVDKEAEELALDVREQARSMPDPSMEAVFDHAYAEPHALVDEERADHLRVQRTLEDPSS
ncbi:pyruvate dehydrogenase (acetyl-transferring) E1 component subunit alpha [Streptomyces sp. W16]|uniref:pyruvate dehydrogenase (acetyl-transferring) E1 component subunit alpha n=1 Tax=Streptomyces sp. W16 TaxID=3076631 RepID=UPI00295BDAAB|nr:pyruvate dehydrogenase (acetyl-transferring) E1 component subunit alpha [Streptomyces sp. W16]MDV9170865.1 pyruvate dehydrogenase (acetyl-transferring) E1 component subunit alpha [Streptomyces sp. W16]